MDQVGVLGIVSTLGNPLEHCLKDLANRLRPSISVPLHFTRVILRIQKTRSRVVIKVKPTRFLHRAQRPVKRTRIHPRPPTYRLPAHLARREAGRTDTPARTGLGFRSKISHQWLQSTRLSITEIQLAGSLHSELTAITATSPRQEYRQGLPELTKRDTITGDPKPEMITNNSP